MNKQLFCESSGVLLTPPAPPHPPAAQSPGPAAAWVWSGGYPPLPHTAVRTLRPGCGGLRGSPQSPAPSSDPWSHLG